MNAAPAFTVRRVTWNAECAALRTVRAIVFIDEQRVPEELEWDDMDAVSIHVLATAAGGEPIGTGRLLPDGHIGRMAVLKPWRGHGVGAALLNELIGAATEHRHDRVELSAQTHAIGFYHRFGFEVTSAEYLEVEIPHRAMRLELMPR